MSTLKHRRYRKRWEDCYGFGYSGDPRKFRPDEDSCLPEELAAHKAALEARAHLLRYHQAGPVHLCVAPWGIGTYRYAVRERGNPVQRRLVNEAEVAANWIRLDLEMGHPVSRQPRVTRGQKR